MGLDFILKNEDKAVFGLCALFGKYGYSQYKMSKFEEYDLYVKNKDFLVSENVITFTDTDGKLLALKPDVTLSIIKNSKDSLDGVQKLYYSEHVYRVSKGTKSFKEIMQVGLECIGNIDDYSISEVLMLAVYSLKSISDSFVLDVSSIDVVKAVMDEANLSSDAQKDLITFIAEKNINAVNAVCDRENVKEKTRTILQKLVAVYGSADKVEREFNKESLGTTAWEAFSKLIEIVKNVQKLSGCESINIDFSVASDVKYYNGIVFKGFIDGVPTGILSGGQYDKLMRKMNKKANALGFAVYLDEILRLYNTDAKYDVDVAVEYGDACAEKVGEVVKSIIDGGESVIAQKVIPEKLKYKRLIKLGEKE